MSERPMTSDEVSAGDLRHAFGHFATGVAIVTSLDTAGRPVGTTANAITSVSLDPPLILVCFDHSSNTLTAVKARGAFGVNVLSESHRELSTHFASSGPGQLWEELDHAFGSTGIPRLGDAIAHVECTVEHRFRAGDHEIVVGRVVDIEVNEEDLPPLLFFRGAYASLRPE